MEFVLVLVHDVGIQLVLPAFLLLGQALLLLPFILLSLLALLVFYPRLFLLMLFVDVHELVDKLEVAPRFARRLYVLGHLLY